ncbi:MAG: hypothetical protein GY763_08855 [Gammaproteobacteria bacterium]|nr:hypothetical protein [Gammaproteobacteria bacterium]
MNQYQLKPSSSLLIVTIALYILFTFGLLIFYEFDWISALLLMLAGLLSYTAFKDYSQAEKANEILALIPSTGTVEHEIDGQSRQFETFKVYTNRWSVVLKSTNRGYRQSLVFIPDRFNSKHEYLDFRYRLIHLKQDVNAC